MKIIIIKKKKCEQSEQRGEFKEGSWRWEAEQAHRISPVGSGVLVGQPAVSQESGNIEA